MRELEYRRPADASEAVAWVSGVPDATFVGGGSNLVDHLKLGIASPRVLSTSLRYRWTPSTSTTAYA
ncbi:MAG: FAD binding domain-containing protein [Nocardioides sp.]|nr:FAD binding domain-containing protein [Nocardioides sp.]